MFPPASEAGALPLSLWRRPFVPCMIRGGGARDGYHYFHAARADLLRRLGAREASAAAYARALELAGNAAERAFLERRLDESRA